MNFAEELKSKSNEKKLEFAKVFLKDLKPKLIKSANEGYRAFRIDIEKNNSDNLQIQSSQFFIDYLNKNLDGVKAEYKKDFIESPFLKGYGSYEHYLIFSW